MKKLFYLIFFLFLIASCSKDKELQLEGTTNKTKQKISFRTEDDLTLYMTKIPISSELENKVSKMRYELTLDGLEMPTIVREYDVDEILENIDSPGYLWKIVEDAKEFEISLFGQTRINSNFDDIINETDEILEFEVECPEFEFNLSKGAIPLLELFIDMVENDPFLLYGGEDCIENSPYYELWRYLGDFYPSQEIINSISQIWDGLKIRGLNAASSGNVNLDFHSIQICDLPYYPDGTQLTPWELFTFLRSQFYIDPFDSGCNTDFELYTDFTDEHWIDTPEGTLFKIDISLSGIPVNIEDGDVVCSYYNEETGINTELLGYRWIFSTVYGRESGYHPVSGNRQFGLYPDVNGCWVFYTSGVDRQTTWFHSIFGGEFAFEEADNFWDCIISQVSDFVIANDGEVAQVTSIHCRPDWAKIRESWKNYCFDPPTNQLIPPCTECL